jgi:diguanylate cyclase (GGDEF)-like protein
MDTRTRTAIAVPAFVARPDVKPVAVTRWTARLADRQCEHDFRVERFATDRWRASLLLVLAGIAGSLNFLVELYAYSRGDSGIDVLIPPLLQIFFPILGLLIAQHMRSPVVLEAGMIVAVLFGSFTRLSMLTLHPELSFMWPTMMIGIVFVIYLYMPLRFVIAASLAFAVSIVAPAWWLLAQGPLLPPDQLYRGLVWLLFANALGFTAANSLQRSQRAQYAQSLVLKEMLSTDSMTGIGNRRRFDDALDREWRRCSRSVQPLSLLMIDVDHFKAYNDHCGHLQGDDCLRLVARLLVENVVRPGDLVARYGGEEFVCLLPEIGESGARAVAAKLATVIAKADILHPALSPESRLTISIGVATATDLAERHPAALVALADKLMYDAKRAGRDQMAVGLL